MLKSRSFSLLNVDMFVSTQICEYDMSSPVNFYRFKFKFFSHVGCINGKRSLLFNYFFVRYTLTTH